MFKKKMTKQDIHTRYIVIIKTTGFNEAHSASDNSLGEVKFHICYFLRLTTKVLADASQTKTLVQRESGAHKIQWPVHEK